MMALTGEDKEIRMSDSLPGFNPLEDLDQPPQAAAQDLQLGHQDNKYGGVKNISPAGAGGFKSKLSTTATAPPQRARYRECLKNHAASIGGNVTDGCGEFMPSGEEGTLEALKCAACNCHRNFHRKERSGGCGGGDGIMVVHPLQLPGPPPMPSPSSIHHHHRNWGAPTSLAAQPVKMAFGSGGGGGGGSAATDSSSEELNFNPYQSSSAQPGYILAKKRYRTKFTPDQKDKMLEFAEKLGWRIPREDDSQLQTFCAEVGVKRQVFKVWMHNNKSSAKKNNPQQEDHQQQPPGIGGI